MSSEKPDKPDYVLVYDGEGGVRMAPAGTRVDLPPERQMSWPAQDDEPLMLDASPEAYGETVTTPRRPNYVLLAVGAACVCLVALGLGLAMRPKLESIVPPRPAPMQPAPQQQADAQMKVMVLDPPPAAIPAAPRGGRLEVLPVEQRQGGVRAVAAVASTAPPLLAVRAPQPVVADPPPGVDASARTPDHFAYGCDRAPSLAAAMVCRDPDLQTADRRMRRAFRAAMRAGGMSPGQLRAEQDDWLEIREDAAQRSPRAVAQVYDQRIEELEALASDGPSDR